MFSDRLDLLTSDSEFITQLRKDIWEFGNLAWVFALSDRIINGFGHGLPSAIALTQFFTIAFFALCWLFLNPNPNGSAEALYNAFQPTTNQQRPTPSLDTIRRYGYQQTSTWKGWKIHHTVFPNARSQVPIIFVHGFGGSIGHWRQNMSALAKSHSVYAIDLLGFGASDKPDIEYSVELWTRQLHDFWKVYIDKPVILVGNSIGSLTCLATAAAHPDMVQGVAMISLPDTASHHETIPLKIRPYVRYLQNILSSPLFLYPLFYVLRQPWVVRHWASLAYSCKEAVTDELLEILIKPSRTEGSARAFCAILKAMMSPKFSPSVGSIFSQVKMPSLLLWGKKDRMIPIGAVEQFSNYNPKLQIVTLDNAGHCAHDECPEQVNLELETWIQTEVLIAK
ncbi:alpha/beta fold hydrolase [Myxacorys almedinensis]|uniref:Alpha/beta fold hydrolase n=1 Tax=Myxacorys almedinensis A TaxID=2690445 RepID=A0A8J8CHR1_9CYAN|nr:alpha/beta fold hydrolase [Myxacorys almedinensis]NDJ16968.1 alpha/beta fold hydrolase [Myxacorys almedinensis A]